ncbi:hypothetical protein AC1031_003262 [Aphanomyces cochlioides]|nr:hypothetical protein AC1031_003262 [Aphanomyces cochlioides]
MEKTRQPEAISPRMTVRLMPRRIPFISGIANRYDDDFPLEMESLVSEAQFSQAINQINNTLSDYWPCFFCVCCGYLCCLCTGGLSLLCPNMCIHDAEQYTRTLIDRINLRPCFREARVEWKLVKTCCRSWIEVSFPMRDDLICTYKTVATDVPPVATSGGDASIYNSSEIVV